MEIDGPNKLTQCKTISHLPIHRDEECFEGKSRKSTQPTSGRTGDKHGKTQLRVDFLKKKSHFVARSYVGKSTFLLCYNYICSVLSSTTIWGGKSYSCRQLLETSGTCYDKSAAYFIDKVVLGFLVFTALHQSQFLTLCFECRKSRT